MEEAVERLSQDAVEAASFFPAPLGGVGSAGVKLEQSPSVSNLLLLPWIP